MNFMVWAKNSIRTGIKFNGMNYFHGMENEFHGMDNKFHGTDNESVVWTRNSMVNGHWISLYG